MGYSFITPRWLFVIAQATPVELVGDPILIDEAIARFTPNTVEPGDIVGIGISTDNCLAGYKALRQAKLKGATVIMGGVHSSVFPHEPLEMGADAVITGNGDVVWRQAVSDALNHRLRRQYVGGRLPGDSMLKARWDLLDPTRYLMASVQTVAGCPENCSFCSVWVTDGRHPRQRLTDRVIEEVNQLSELGFRYIVFADDNFNPATLGRIAREPSPRRRRDLELIREERLRLFDAYDLRVPRNVFAFTQMTSEVITDDEYLAAMYHKMRIRTALIGVESFSEEGLARVGKQWNPAGRKMIETIQKIQERGILVLSSIICGLESDTVETLRTMRRFALESGSVLAQFTLYRPFPGTKDFYEMIQDRENRCKAGFVGKHKSQLVDGRYWLTDGRQVEVIRHPNLSADQWIAENKRCWNTFYSLKEVLRRTRRGVARSWPLPGKLTYLLVCLGFKRIYAGDGITADSAHRKKLGPFTRIIVRSAVAIYSYFFRQKRIGLKVPVMRRPGNE